MRNLVRKTMNEALDNYIHQILNHDEDSKNSSLSKNFWKYIKSRKKDSMGISPLQNLPGMYIIDNKGKAEILNKQYDSVFTDENLEQTPQLGNSSVPSIDQLNITKKRKTTQYNREQSLHITEETRFYKGK